jgi:hypothetical protein
MAGSTGRYQPAPDATQIYNRLYDEVYRTLFPTLQPALERLAVLTHGALAP